MTVPSLSVLLAFVAVLALPGPVRAEAAAAAQDPIAWVASYGEATKKAADAGKPLLFKFYTGWCPHCTRMDQTTWKDASLADTAKSFVAAKVNADVEKVPVNRYRLVGYPTVIVAEPGGEEILRLEGYKEAKVVQAFAKAYLEHAPAITAAHATLRTTKGDPGALCTLGDFYSTVGLAAEAADRYLDAAKKATGDMAIRARVGAGAALVRTKEYKAAAKALEPALAAAGAAPPAGLLLASGQAEAGLGDAAGARERFEKLIQLYPGAPEATAAREALAALGGA